MTAAPQNSDAEAKKAARIEYAKEGGKLRKFLGFVESLIVGPYVLGDELSIADLSLVGLVTGVQGGQFDYVTDEVFSATPKVLALVAAAREQPLVAAELASKK
eukprot:TRINITY_DN5_c0_g1_i3.p1 TRINITY_DN5_c0_g1~~TRINITY_DN5_c0_g1_i3.p1  ORF type:complete len:103 (-),score=51.42 TRINITY_DN5_c0_g1_i3:41-349(-)